MVEKPEGRSWQSIGKNLGSVTCTPLQTSLVVYNVRSQTIPIALLATQCHTLADTSVPLPPSQLTTPLNTSINFVEHSSSLLESAP